MVCIGAGFAGLTLAYKVLHEKKLNDVIDLQVYERLVCSSREACLSELDRSSL